MNLYAMIREDIQTIFRKDPAARSMVEVLTCYPGLHSIWMHRLAHALWRRRFFFIGRLISHLNRFVTGIEIHPGARIGRRFFIDHGSGVVIGETTEIGDDVHIYQGVVLGGVSLERKKRHPTIGNGVMIGAGAIVLGPINLGENSRVGAASLVLGDVPPRAVAVGVPARVGLGFSGKDLRDLADNKLPDPVANAFMVFNRQIESLERRIERMEYKGNIDLTSDRHIFGENISKKEEFIMGHGI
ncbi:MAG TPA: serine O-acetyltransferase [Desulfobacteraceae bacterium]|nr:serine O-acetyltransferase [Desulfobacteraceae bacterium]